MTHTVLAIFDNRVDAEEAVNDLKDHGYNAKDISVVMKNNTEAEVLSENTGADVAGGAVEGATTGALVGGLAGLLAATVIPGLGAFFIGGPIAAALGLGGAAASTVSGAATGAVAGGLIGALTGLGVSAENAKVYEQRINAGGILVAVPVSESRVDEVKELFEDYDATDIEYVEHANESGLTFQGHSHTDDSRRTRGRKARV